ncbi:acyltransferase family protein [Actinosynnema sp. NPDC004786]
MRAARAVSGRVEPLDGRSSLSGREPAEKTRIAFIDIGRGLAALLVFYSHLAEQWIAKREAGPTPVIDVVDAVTSDPMHMGLQGIGQVAVPFFFLVSGYVVTPVALRQGARGFGLNRLVRVYVPMTFVVLLTAAVILLGGRPLGGGNEPVITWWTVVTNALTINYLIVPQVVMVGVAWTLVVEVIFYVLLVALLPVMRRAPWLAISVQLVFIFVVMMTNRQLGPSWLVFAVNVSYLAIPLIGQIVWATTTKRVPLWLGGVFAGAAWALYVLADHLKFGRLDASYNLALAVAVLCFLMGMFAEPRLVERRIWVGLSERSYSIYLLHGLVAFTALDLLRPQVPLWLAVPIAIAVTFGVVELSYRYVEKPSHVLARRLARKPAPKPVPEPAEPESDLDDDLDNDLEDDFEDVEEPEDAAEDAEDAEWPDDEPEPVREEPTEVLPRVRSNRLRTPPPQRRPPFATRPQGPPVPRTPPPRSQPSRPDAPRPDAPRPPAPRPDARPHPPRPEPARPETPRADAPRHPAARPEPPRPEAPRPEPLRSEAFRSAAPRPQPPRTPARDVPLDRAPVPGPPAPRPPLARPVPAPGPAEETRHLPAAWPADEPEPEEVAPRRRRLRDDSGPVVTVASLLENHARENGRRR